MARDIAVYTAVFGNYDAVIEPVVPEENVDYICFTDTPERIPDVWETRRISSSSMSPKLQSGEIKIKPHEYLDNYQTSVWIDANIIAINDIRSFVGKHLTDFDLAVPDHPTRDCTYKEAEVCIAKGITSEKRTHEKIQQYRSDGFPEKNGLSETGLILRNHQEDSVIQAMNTWWEEYQTGPERDQISFEYAIWKNNFQYLRLPSRVYDDSVHFKYYPHKDEMPVGSLYERALAWKWNKPTKIQNWLGTVLLAIYSYINLLLISVEIIQKSGVKKFVSKIRHRYSL